MRFLAKLAITAAAVWAAVALVSGLSFDGSAWAFFGVALLVALVNGIVKPILNILTIPFILLTLGLFLLITNAVSLQLVLWLADPGRLDLGFASTGFFWATFLGALVISAARMLLEKAFSA